MVQTDKMGRRAGESAKRFCWGRVLVGKVSDEDDEPDKVDAGGTASGVTRCSEQVNK